MTLNTRELANLIVASMVSGVVNTPQLPENGLSGQLTRYWQTYQAAQRDYMRITFPDIDMRTSSELREETTNHRRLVIAIREAAQRERFNP